MNRDEKVGLDDQWAQALTDPRLADDLRRLASDIRFDNPDMRAARLREAARRLDGPRPSGQMLVTLDDGRQVAYMHGNVFVRSTVGLVWPGATPQSTTPHQPGTWYRGEW